MPFDGTPPTRLINARTVIFLNAAKRIEHPRRWDRGRMNGRRFFFVKTYCMLGAIEWATETHDLDVSYQSMRKLADRVARRRGFETAAAFNDHPDTTHYDVLEFLREAAIMA